jgi:tetratricopeptide (TPR) repeat protein
MTAEFWPDFNDLWDYYDPAATEKKFRELLPKAKASGDEAYYLQLMTQIARSLSLQKKFEQAHQILDEVESQMQGGDIVEVRYRLERGRTFNSAGEPERAVPLFKRAVQVSETIEADFYAVDAYHMLGIAASPEERLEWNLTAIAYAEKSSDERARNWLGSLYNNTGWTMFDEKRYKEALDLFQKALAHREQQGQEREIRVARWCVAKTLRVSGRVEEALAIQRELESTGESDGFTEEEIAECLLALGEAEASKPYFQRAYEKLSQIDWVAEDQARMEHLKSLSA